jgi:hypothetical protein
MRLQTGRGVKDIIVVPAAEFAKKYGGRYRYFEETARLLINESVVLYEREVSKRFPLPGEDAIVEVCRQVRSDNEKEIYNNREQLSSVQ